MPDTPPLARLPEYQSYDCTTCGICCRGLFSIVLRDDDVARIKEQGWEQDPALKGETLFVPFGDRLRLNHRKGGACVFLGDDNLCRIHAKFGEPAKPIACRTYPFKCIPTGEVMHIDLRYDCPAVAANVGRPISAHQQAVEELLPDLYPNGIKEQPVPQYLDGVPVSWDHVARVTDLFQRLLRHRACDLTSRVVACVDAIELLRTLRIDTLDAVSLDRLLDTIFQKATAAMAAKPIQRSAPSSMMRTAFRQHLSVYGRVDRYGARTSLWQRLRIFVGMVNGNGFIPRMREDFPANVPFLAVEEPLGIPPDEVLEPLERCLRLRLESQGFFGPLFYNFNYLDGLSAMLLTFPMVLWFARAAAIGRGLPVPDASCVAYGVQLANHAYGISPVQNLPAERTRLRQLCERKILRHLIIWYGR